MLFLCKFTIFPKKSIINSFKSDKKHKKSAVFIKSYNFFLRFCKKASIFIYYLCIKKFTKQQLITKITPIKSYGKEETN